MRNIVKKSTKRIGRAFGASEIIDISKNTEQIVNQNREQLSLYTNDFWRFAFPYIKYYYFNEFAKSLHPLLFERYRGCNKGKKVVIVACGPSVDNYIPIKDAKHLAINRAFLREDIKFDYIFMHDSVMVSKYKNKLKNYNADKFVAYATFNRNAELFNTKSADIVEIGAKRFIISDPSIPDIAGGQFDVIQPDITKGLIMDRGGGTVFSALQFLLFTQPKELYLVGCDCTKNGYFGKIKKNTKQNLLEKTEYLWHEVKAFTDQYYPDVKIISINPVTLRGLFTDLDQ